MKELTTRSIFNQSAWHWETFLSKKKFIHLYVWFSPCIQIKDLKFFTSIVNSHRGKSGANSGIGAPYEKITSVIYQLINILWTLLQVMMLWRETFRNKTTPHHDDLSFRVIMHSFYSLFVIERFYMYDRKYAYLMACCWNCNLYSCSN